MTEGKDMLKSGTTTLGIVFRDGVLLGSERRATMGTLIAHKTTQKIFKIDDFIGMTTAGLVGDAQLLARYLSAEAELYKLKHGEPMTIKAATTLMANILAGNRLIPYWVQLLIGGVDADGVHVYSLDPAGGAIPDIYVTTGSGAPYAYGVLEEHFKENMSRDEVIDLGIRCLHASMSRDAASGNGMELVIISKKKGWTLVDEKEIDKRIAKLGLKKWW